MNKLMKFCGKCEEAFADRFAFCPNCGGELEVYEMNPVTAQAPVEVQASPVEPVATPVILAEAAAKDADVLEIPAFEAANGNGNGSAQTGETLETNMAEMSAPAKIEVVEAPPAKAGPVYVSAPKHEVPPAPVDNNGWREVKSKSLVPADDGLYHVTMVESKTIFNDPRFRATGIFALVTVLTLTFGSIIYSLFDQYVNVNSPDSYDLVSAVYISDDPIDVDQEKMPKDKNQGGGGGGGGRNDPEPASEGRIAPMLKTPPLITPSKEDISVSDPSLVVYRTIQGNKELIKDNNGQPLGVGLGKIPSDGMGGGMGQGGGDGSGQGPGRGNGAGPGQGGGIGSGCCGGVGNGNGPGGGDDAAPEMPRGPSKALSILSKPQPQYTEEARKNQISGTVRLRVIFNSNGSIGSVTAISGLGYGLTEKAIAAAHSIRFEPALKNGSPTSVSKTIEYNFNLY